jgi:KDO2-lipid IV(A) lauroyltransferase
MSSLPLQYLQYVAVRTAATSVSLHATTGLAAMARIGSLYHRLAWRRRRRAELNLRRSFPEWSPGRVAEVAERSVHSMLQTFLVDVPITPRLITPSTWPQYISLSSVGPMLEVLLRGDPAILVTGHCGNWELLGHALAVMGHPVTALARPLDNPFLNRWVLRLREARGTSVLTKWGAVPALEDLLSRGGRAAFIADQNAGDQGLFVPFFGRLASSYKSIGLLAMRYRVPIIAGVALRRDDRFAYEISCVDLIRAEEWDPQPDPLFYITARFNRAIETMIRMAPEQYLWVHRRWKSRPRHERTGRPFPPRLLEKLRSLPWMTESELQAIVRRSEAEAAAAGPGPGIE